MSNMSNELFKELESTHKAPASIKQGLLAEVDLIRDMVRVGTMYTADFFSVVLTTLSHIDQAEHP